MKRVIVGTMRTIENEYDQCIAAIMAQRDVKVECFTIENLPNKLAHDTLYQKFMDRADECDYFVKVDADMVVENSSLFAQIGQYFDEHPQLDDIEMAVHDYMSDSLILGMHAYRNTVRWQVTQENLFVDAHPVPPERRKVCWKDLVPACVHCKDPSDFQAFHYGMHAAMKIVQPGRPEWHVASAMTLFRQLERVWQHFLRVGDRRLALAVLAAEMTYRGELRHEHVDNTNPHAREVCRQYANMNAKTLGHLVRRRRLLNWSWVTTRYRMAVLRRRRGWGRRPWVRGGKVIRQG